MSRLLWIGDAGVETGFAKCTHETCKVLQQLGWDVHVLALNFSGDFVPGQFSWPMYRAASGGDPFGYRRTAEIIKKINPDLVLVQNDPWNVRGYMKQNESVKMVASMPVDGFNCQGRALNGLAGAIFWTEFGKREAERGGYSGPSSVIPLGVDLKTFYPIGKAEARSVHLPTRLRDAFIVGFVGRNQPRKRIDLLIAYFAGWIHSYDVKDAYLFIHAAPTGETEHDIVQLATYYGVQNRIIISNPEPRFGVEEEKLIRLYACFDVMLTCTQGEGWGLTHMEGMACGVPQVVPDWAALGEWTAPAALRVPCSSTAATLNGIGVIGGIMDREAFLTRFNALAISDEQLAQRRHLGLTLVQDAKYRWENVGMRFHEALTNALEGEGIRAEA